MIKWTGQLIEYTWNKSVSIARAVFGALLAESGNYITTETGDYLKHE